MASQGAGVCRAPFSRIEAVLNRVSMVSVDLPPPETPVTQVKVPSGKSAVTPAQVVAGGVHHRDAACRCPCAARPGSGSRAGRSGTGR